MREKGQLNRFLFRFFSSPLVVLVGLFSILLTLFVGMHVYLVRYTPAAQPTIAVHPGEEVEGVGARVQNAPPVVSPEATAFRTAIAPFKGMVPLTIFATYYQSLGSGQMLSILEERPYCHDEAHNLGRLIYQKTTDFSQALHICGARCNTGCFHGVLMAALSSPQGTLFSDPSDVSHKTIDQLKEQMFTVCGSQDVKEVIGYGSCIHGVGHAVANLAGTDLTSALTICAAFNQKGEEYYCATGVYMERDLENGEADLKTSVLYPCDQFAFPAGCFRYKLRRSYSNHPIETVRDVCAHLASDIARQGCFHGLGFGFFKTIIDHSNTLGFLCDVGDSVARRMCIEGAIGAAVVYNPPKAALACTHLVGGDRLICQRALDVQNFGMGRDFDLYYQKSSQ